MKPIILLLLLCGAGLPLMAGAQAALHPDVNVLQGFLGNAREFDRVNKEVTRISNHREQMRQQWQKKFDDIDLVKQVSGRVWYACALLGFGEGCPAETHYIDQHRARELLADTLALLEKREKISAPACASTHAVTCAAPRWMTAPIATGRGQC